MPVLRLGRFKADNRHLRVQYHSIYETTAKNLLIKHLASEAAESKRSNRVLYNTHRASGSSHLQRYISNAFIPSSSDIPRTPIFSSQENLTQSRTENCLGFENNEKGGVTVYPPLAVADIGM